MTAFGHAEPETGRDLVRKLRSTSRSKSLIDVTQIKFVALDSIRGAYGERWRIERRRIQEMANGFIAKRLQPVDVIIPCENGFLIVFCESECSNAANVSEAIGRELNCFLLAETNDERFKIEVRHETLAAKNLTGFINSAPKVNIVKARRGRAQLSEKLADQEITFRFQPVWDAKNEAINTYFVEPISTANGQRVSGYQFEDGIFASPRLLDVDELAVKVSERALRSLVQRDKKINLGISLHISSLMKAENRARILSAMSCFAPELIKFRTVRICGVVPGFPRLYLNETVNLFSARVPRVVVSMSAEEDDFSTALACNVSGLGYTLPADPRSRSTPAFLNKVRRDVAAAHARQKRFYIDGPLTEREAVSCRACEADFISSPLVWAPADDPPGALRWPAALLASGAAEKSKLGSAVPPKFSIVQTESA